MIRLACPLVTVDSPKKAIALKVVQILLGTSWFNAKVWRCHGYFPYENDIIRLKRLHYCHDTIKHICTVPVTLVYLHFLCESLNEPLHLAKCSYFMNNIASRDVTWHPWMRAILAYQRQGHPITLFVY